MSSATPIFEGKECLGCGYELAGSTSDHCPECGRLNQPLTLLATYRERQWGLRREFFLYEDRIIVRRRQWMGDEIEQPIRLAILQPDFGVRRTRSHAFAVASSVCVTCSGIAGLSWMANRDDNLLQLTMLWLFGGTSGICLFVAIWNWKRVEYYFFGGKLRPDIRLVDIARRGPDVASFEDFAGKLRRQIRAASKPKAQPK